MRSCLSYGLWQNCSYNFHQSHASGRLFEIGKVFCRETEIKETFNLAMIIWGEDIDLWSKTVAPPVLSLKAPLEKLGYQIQNFEKSKVPEFLHTGQSAQIKEGDKNVGFIGTLHPKILNDAKVRVPVAICELELRLNKKTSGKFQGFAKFPVVERDLALLMKSNQSSDQVLALIKQEASGLLQEVFVFDQYLGENLPKGFKSLTIRMKLQDKNGTLQDSQVSQLQEKVLAALKSKLNISVR
jgi:phenylalanyl-tRNA synthetase beta chain